MTEQHLSSEEAKLLAVAMLEARMSGEDELVDRLASLADDPATLRKILGSSSSPVKRTKGLKPPALKPKVKAPYLTKDSYFTTCERDKEGHCLPKGSAGQEPGPKRRAVDAGSGHERIPNRKEADRRFAPPPPGEKLAPPAGPAYKPDPSATDPGTGLPCCSRVGVPAMWTPPPPKKIPRLPNLTDVERAAESRFADWYEKHWVRAVDLYDRKRNNVVGRKEDGSLIYEVGDAPHIFSTDDAKVLSPDYNPKGEGVTPESAKAAKGIYNTAVHQTANAIAKKAFVRYLDEVAKMPPEKRRVLVTSGGVAAGKGFALKSIPETASMVNDAGAVWDAAGEQNATENPWVLQECRKRGLKCVFAFVNADPDFTWDNPGSGVVERAGKVGRMVDARVYADSYALGARNFKAFMDQHIDDPDVDFHVFNNPGAGRGKPTKLERVPQEALDLDAERIYKRAVDVVERRKDELSPAVVRGGTMGTRVWGLPEES